MGKRGGQGRLPKIINRERKPGSRAGTGQGGSNPEGDKLLRIKGWTTRGGKGSREDRKREVSSNP